MPALSFHLMPASEIHQRYITTPFDDLSQPFWCKRRAIVVQGRMQPVVHRPRAKSDVTLTRCSVACRDLLGGAGIETLGVRRLVFAEGPMDFAGSTQVAYRAQTNSTRPLSIGVMIAGNSGRPGGAIYAPWFASLAKRLQGVRPGHWTQQEGILAAWLVGSERTAPHQLLAEMDQLRTETLMKMESRFLHCLYDKWGMVENDVKAFEGFIDRDGSASGTTHRWPDDVRQRWLATRQGVDYVHTEKPLDYGDAWILPDADLCVDLSDGGTTGWRFFKLDQIVRTTLIFVAGPNACPRKGNHMMGSMLRTQNKRVLDEICSHIIMLRTASGQDVHTLQNAAIEEAAPFFVACVRAAMRAGLDAAIEAGIDVIVLARISGGIYAGAWRDKMTREFYRKLVEDLLEEEVVVTVASPTPTASGQDAAPDPQDAAPVPNRDTASSQYELETQPESAHDGSASGQISEGPPSKRRRMDNGDEDADQGVEMPCETTSDAFPACAFAFSSPGVLMPRTMPRGAFFQNVIMPWID